MLAPYSALQRLSQLIIADRDDLIQKCLDSPITGFSDWSLLIREMIPSYIRLRRFITEESWQGHIAQEDLAHIKKTEPFDLLTDPPPLGAGWEHPSPRAEKAVPARGFVRQKGRVLGHLYYVRPDPPPFFEDLFGFFSTGFFEMSGAKRGYLYITLTTMAFGAIVILMIWLRQRGLEMKQGELEYLQRELDIRKKALENLAAELTTQKARKAWLEKEADSSYKRALTLKQSLERLKDALSLATATANSTANQMPVTNGLSFDGDGLFKIRSQSNPPSALLEEIEELIPALTDNAVTLKSQAGLLNDYCSVLEQRQAEMKSIVDQAYFKTSKMAMSVAGENFIDMTP